MHLNCPHCHNPIEIVDDGSAELPCPSCGSQIDLDAIRYKTKTWDGNAPAMQVGRFECVAWLGEGAFGTVWKALDPQLGVERAVKVPRAGVLGGPEFEDKFLREARAAAALRHDGIVTIHEAGRQDGTVYIVSDLIRGVTLADWLSGKRPEFRQAAELVAELADALDYAHRHGVVHRDLKPANIMLRLEPESATGSSGSGSDTRQGRSSGETAQREAAAGANARSDRTPVVKAEAPLNRGTSSGGSGLRPVILDFGLAKHQAAEIAVTRSGAILGTPAYMSPEQAGGHSHRVDARSDVYSLGVILYELLTGERPFRGVERMILHQVLHDEPRPPRQLNDQVPRDVDTIAIKCLQKVPDRRYASAADLAADLRRWRSGEPILARPISASERLWRWCRRNPAVASLTAVVAIVLLAGITVSSFFAIKANQALLHHRKGDLERLLVARPANVPQAIEQLRPSKDWALPQLRELMADDRVGFLERFHAALAQSEFSEPDLPFLIAALEKLPSEEMPNLQRVLLKHAQTATRHLQSDLSQNESDVVRGMKTASVLFYLGRLDEAQNWFFTPGRTECRTYFVHHLSEWLGDSDGFSNRLLKINDPGLLAMLCLALGVAGRERLPTDEGRRVENALQKLWHESPSGGVHSAVDWTIRKWNSISPQPFDEERREAPPRGWYVNSLGMTLIAVNPGRFVRRDRADLGGTENTVILSRPFWLASREVTRAQYEEFVADNPEVERDEDWLAVDQRISPEPMCPAQNVTWHMAIEFCNWLSRREGLSPCYRRTPTDVEWDGNADGYRLPTEAEWELACRAGSERLFCFGNDQTLLSRYAWIGDAAQERTHRVAHLVPNAWGLFDRA